METFILQSLFDISINQITAIVALISILVVVVIVIKLIERKLLKSTKTKILTHEIKVVSTLITYGIIILVLLLIITSYFGLGTEFGLSLGFFSAALGFALQKPISGIAAWIAVLIYAPFKIGDRILINNIRGDVIDIKPLHIHLEEIGGIVGGEEKSKRTILVPTATLFDINVINYTKKTRYVLDQVLFSITFSSNLKKVKKISTEVVSTILPEIIKETGEKPYIRTFFATSGINVHVRYLSYAIRLEEFSSAITEEIFNRIKKEKDIDFAYPHTKLVF